YFTASKVTSDFMVDRLDEWWRGNRPRYPKVRKLLLGLDNGPEDHSRRTQFIYRLGVWGAGAQPAVGRGGFVGGGGTVTRGASWFTRPDLWEPGAGNRPERPGKSWFQRAQPGYWGARGSRVSLWYVNAFHDGVPLECEPQGNASAPVVTPRTKRRSPPRRSPRRGRARIGAQSLSRLPKSHPRPTADSGPT